MLNARDCPVRIMGVKAWGPKLTVYKSQALKKKCNLQKLSISLGPKGWVHMDSSDSPPPPCTIHQSVSPTSTHSPLCWLQVPIMAPRAAPHSSAPEKQELQTMGPCGNPAVGVGREGRQMAKGLG